MRTIIAGSRSVRRYEDVDKAVSDSGFGISKVISGGAAGADSLGEQYARKNGIPIERHIPLWKIHGARAGFIRNEAMAASAHALVAIWDGKSKGTRHMIEQARKRKLKVHVHRIDSDNNGPALIPCTL